MEPLLMLTSFIGFGIGIVAMSILHTWFYAKTKSVFLAIVIHAAFNIRPTGSGLHARLRQLRRRGRLATLPVGSSHRHYVACRKDRGHC